MKNYNLEELSKKIDNREIDANSLENNINELDTSNIDNDTLLEFMNKVGKYIDGLNNGSIKLNGNVFPTIDDNRNPNKMKKELEEICKDKHINIYIYNNKNDDKIITVKIDDNSNKYINSLINKLYTYYGLDFEFYYIKEEKNNYFNLDILSLNSNEFDDKYKYVLDTAIKVFNQDNGDETIPPIVKKVRDLVNDDFYIRSNNIILGYTLYNNNTINYLVSDGSSKLEEYAKKLNLYVKRNDGFDNFEIDLPVENPAEPEPTRYRNENDSSVYNNLSADLEVAKVIDFIETSPTKELDDVIVHSDGDNRIVEMIRNEDNKKTVTFNHGKYFDSKILPLIITSYISSNIDSLDYIKIKDNNIYFNSSNKTNLTIRTNNKNEVDSIIKDIKKKYQDKRNIRVEKVEKEEQDRGAFVSLSVLFVITILFVLIISLLVFAN